MADYETPNVLADSAKVWLCEQTRTSVFFLQITVDDRVAKEQAKREEPQPAEDTEEEVPQPAEIEDTECDDDESEMLYCTGFAVDANDEKKLRILTSFRLMEKYEESVIKIFDDFGVESIGKAFTFEFICIHVEDNYRRNPADERSCMPIEVLDVDHRNSLVLLEIDLKDVTTCQEHHQGLKMANRRPPKGQEFLFRAWPSQCADVILWRSVSNKIDRDSQRIFQSHSGNMKLIQFSMTWENDETTQDQGVEQYCGGPVIDGNGAFFGVFYGVHDWDGYATALDDKAKSFVLKPRPPVSVGEDSETSTQDRH